MLDERNPPLTARRTLFATGETECDGLVRADWYRLARLVAARLPPYSDALGVPRNGLAFAEALQAYRNPDIEDAYVVADEVWEAGSQMPAFAERMFAGAPWRGIVIYARAPLPRHITAVFVLGDAFRPIGRLDPPNFP